MGQLTTLERQIVSRLRADYEKLSLEGQAELAQAISWAEKHFWPAVLIAFALGGMAGILAAAAFR